MPARDRDLGEMAHRLTRALIRSEQPILERHAVTMWQYAVLSVLARGPAPRQADLAERSGRDPTRLISDLDDLQARGLVERVPDPADRRARVVTLTPRGQRTLTSCRHAIRVMEEEVLAELPVRDRTAFVRGLEQLAGPPVG